MLLCCTNFSSFCDLITWCTLYSHMKRLSGDTIMTLLYTYKAHCVLFIAFHNDVEHSGCSSKKIILVSLVQNLMQPIILRKAAFVATQVISTLHIGMCAYMWAQVKYTIKLRQRLSGYIQVHIKKIEYHEKVNIYCHSFHKVKLIYYVYSLHIEWNISNLYFLRFWWVWLTDNENPKFSVSENLNNT